MNVDQNKECSFLCIHYENMEFLIDRKRFLLSSKPEYEKNIKSPVKYLTSIVRYNNCTLPVFDLDNYFRNAFQSEAPFCSPTVLISRLSMYEAGTRQLLRSIKIKQGNENRSSEYFGIKVPSKSEVLNIPMPELKFIPALLEEVHYKRGILGFRFLNDGKIQYFIDCEIIIVNNIRDRQREYEGQAGSSHW
jgi:hypothetical protein